MRLDGPHEGNLAHKETKLKAQDGLDEKKSEASPLQPSTPVRYIPNAMLLFFLNLSSAHARMTFAKALSFDSVMLKDVFAMCACEWFVEMKCGMVWSG